MTTASLRRRQQRHLAEKRDRIALTVAVQMESDTPHLDGLCPRCRDEEPSLWTQAAALFSQVVEWISGWRSNSDR